MGKQKQYKKILLFYPPNKRSVAIETLCKAVTEAGHELVVLTLTERGAFHQEVEKMGIPTYSHVLTRKPSWKFFLHQSRHLIKFCKQHHIDVVWSHLQEANITALFAQPFLKAKVTTFRHHAESAFYKELGEKFGMTRNKNEVRFDKLTNRLSKKIIIPSSGVWESMEKYEGCNMKKVQLIPYIYDFTTYQQPDAGKVIDMRNNYSCKLMLIMVSRMVAAKQHMPVIEIVKKLVDEGLSIKMIIMDDGPLRQEFESYIKKNGLENHIFLTGFREDFVNYMAASDLLVHPSLTEASNNVVKEMGLLEKAVAVCKNVGDFNDYIVEGKNGYFLERTDLLPSIESVVRDAYTHPEKMKNLGQELKKDVIKHFSDSVENKQRFLELLN
jgi:glycosyltransferase involved in cell wall biosynthesis